MSTYLDVEGAERAARRIESAASEATRAADTLNDAISRLTVLVGSGYGNVAERLLEALENQQEPAESAAPAKCCGICDNYSSDRGRCDHAPMQPCQPDGTCSSWTAIDAAPAPHADTVRGWNTGAPDVPVGAMRRLWCAVLADNGKTYHSMLCYANGYAMQLADWDDEIPDCCKPIPGDEDNLAWFGWYEESCDHCETQWHSSANVIAWMELPKLDAAMKEARHD